MTTLPARAYGSLYLAIAKVLSQADPALAQRMSAEELADLIADSQAVMDATKPGQVNSLEDMIMLCKKEIK